MPPIPIRPGWSGDLVSFLISVALLVAYHVYLRLRIRQTPTYTVQAVHNIARAAWVESVMKNGRDILAVQTLRNSTMAATFLASTAVLLIMGVLSLSGQGDKLESTWHVLNVFGATDPTLWLLKLILLMLDLCWAFFCFTLAVRKFNHVGYLVNLPKDFDHPVITPKYVASYLNRAGRYYSLGMRAYYFTMPLLFWLFGPHLMVASSVILVFLLFHLDRAYDDGD
ncbi:MAG TPA: DUF599 domain-containing protein [Rhodocyclaceae bacterium]|nr:DUF599 domain-containing protein [Rhodocyclaceae bacterium]